MTLPRTVADVLADHVRFEIEAIDRLYLNERVVGESASPSGWLGRLRAPAWLWQHAAQGVRRVEIGASPG
jgi:hypothetical protein